MIDAGYRQSNVRPYRRSWTAFASLLAFISFAFGVANSVHASNRLIEYDVDEGTWMNLDVSADGNTLVFDLLGDIYSMPVAGGQAMPLRQNSSWNTAPRFSQDGKEIWFVSDGDGGIRQLWTMSLTGDGARLAGPSTDRDIVGFTWTSAPDAMIVEQRGWPSPGESVLKIFKNGYRQSLVADPATDRAIGLVADSSPGWVLFAQPRSTIPTTDNFAFDIYRYQPSTRLKQLLVSNGFAPLFARDGRQLAFFRAVDSHADLWIRNLSTGVERKLVDNVGRPRVSGRAGWHMQASQGLMPTYAFAGDSRSIFLESKGKIIRVDVSSGATHIVPFTAHIRKPVTEPAVTQTTLGDQFEARQLRWLNTDSALTTATFFAAGSLWLADLETGLAKPVKANGSRNFAPSLSYDGARLAFVSRGERAGLYAIDIEGAPPRPLWNTDGVLTQPAWSPDGDALVTLHIVERPCRDRPMGRETERHCSIAGPRGSVWAFDVVEVNVQSAARRVIYSNIIPSYGILPKHVTHAPIVYSQDGKRIYFDEYDPKNPQRPRIVSLDRANGKRRIVAEFEGIADADFAIPSPDGRHVAIGFDEMTWIFEVTKGVGQNPIRLNFAQPSRGLKRVGPLGSHAAWTLHGDLIWSVGRQLFRWQPGHTSADNIISIRANVPLSAPRGALALTNATIVPMDSDRVIDHGTIIIEGARIVAVGPKEEISIPEHARVLDVEGKTIVPGFIDTHAHPHKGNCCEWEFPRSDQPRYLASLAWGVTTIFDPQAGDQQTAAFTQSEMIAAGAMQGPRVFTAGTAIFGSLSSYPNKAMQIGGINAICPVVHQRALNGAILVKSYLLSRRDWRQALVGCAKAEGVGVTTEGGGDTNAQLTHYLDGHTSTEHNLFEPVLHDDIVQLIAKSRIFYTPVTPGLYGGQDAIRYFGTRGAFHGDPRLERFPSDQTGSYSVAGGYVPEAKQMIYDVARSAQKIVAAGGRLALGSHSEPDGIGVHHDMWALQLGGLPPFELLRAATISGAEKLGLAHDLGSVEHGKLADLIVLECNPLGNIRCTANTKFVIKSGFIYDPATLAQVYP